MNPHKTSKPKILASNFSSDEPAVSKLTAQHNTRSFDREGFGSKPGQRRNCNMPSWEMYVAKND